MKSFDAKFDAKLGVPHVADTHMDGGFSKSNEKKLKVNNKGSHKNGKITSLNVKRTLQIVIIFYGF